MDEKMKLFRHISLILIISFFAGCAPSKVMKEEDLLQAREEISEKRLEEDAEAQSYSKAEQEYRDGRLDQAKDGFENFISRYPWSHLADDASFNIGEIYFKKGDYHESVVMFQKILRDFPTSPLYGKARLQLARSLLRSENFQDSIQILKSVISGPINKEEKAQVHLLLAQNFHGLGRDLIAISWYLKAKDFVDDEKSILEIEDEVKKIIELNLSRNELFEVIYVYSGRFPSDYACFKLAEIYFMERELTEAKEILTQMLNSYPEHEYRDKAEKLIDTINQRLATDAHAIGCILPLSGKFSMYGEKALRGIELAADVFNPFPKDSPIKLVIKDSKGDPETAAIAVEELVLEDNVICIIGPLLSITAETAAREAQALSVPIMVLSQKSNITEMGDYIFRNSLTPDLQTKAIVDYAIDVLGFEKFSILYPNDHHGNNFMNLFWDEVLKLGGEVIGAESYHADQNDFQDEIKKLVGLYYMEDRKYEMEDMEGDEEDIGADTGEDIEEEFKPIIDFDALFIPDYYNKVGLIVPQLAYYDVVGIQLLGTNGWNSPQLIDMAGEYIEGAIFVDGFFKESPYPFVKKFVEEFEKNFGEEPEILEAQAYDSANMIIELIRNQGIESRYELKEGLYGIKDYPGVSGATSFNLTGDSEKILFILTIEDRNIVQLR